MSSLYPKPIVENYLALRIDDLRKHSLFIERNFCSHVYYFANLKMRLVKDPLAQAIYKKDPLAEPPPPEYPWYLNIENYDPKNRNSTISLITAPCNLGGSREWFECPGCQRRVGVLYYHEDNFSCRKCLGLGYESQRMNYRTIAPHVKRMMEFDKTAYFDGKILYKGKYTRRYLRNEKRVRKIEASMKVIEWRYS